MNSIISGNFGQPPLVFGALQIIPFIVFNEVHTYFSVFQSTAVYYLADLASARGRLKTHEIDEGATASAQWCTSWSPNLMSLVQTLVTLLRGTMCLCVCVCVLRPGHPP